jgi:hypothetical protein
LRRRGQFKGVVVRPILSSAFNSRGRVDLVDMQSMPDGIYRSIMNYQDHLTRQLGSTRNYCFSGFTCNYWLRLIIVAVERVKLRKAAGFDEIPAEVLKSQTVIGIY